MNGVLASFRISRWSQWVVCVLAPLMTGCLSTHFEVPKDELARLTSVAPGQRGRQVRAFQRLDLAETPPRAAEWALPAAPTATAGLEAPVPESVPDAPVRPTTYPYYWVDWGPPYYSPYWRSSTYYVSGPEMLPPGSLGGPTTMSAGKMARDDTKSAIAGVAFLVLIGGFVLAASEAARFDGWVGIHPHHPLHLKISSGGWRVVALDELTPADVRSAEEAVISAREGNGLWLRGRAPLDRAGLTFRMQGGVFNQIMPGGGHIIGSGGDVGLGLFVNQHVGVLGTAGFSVGSQGMGDYVSVRTGLEAQFWPLQAGRFNLGAYAGGGVDMLQAGDGLPETDDNFGYVDFGGAIEVELATRVAWLIRAGAHVTPAAIFADAWALTIGLGLSVY